MPGIDIGFSAHLILVAAGVLAAAAAVYLYYRTTVPPLPRSRRYLLLLLRLASFCTLVILLFQPLLRLALHTTDPPLVAVLVDNSRSMRLSDGSGNRAATLRALLAGRQLRNETARYFTFGARTTEDPRLPADTLSLDEDATDIATPIRDLAQKRESLNIRAAVLLTDGAYTLGENPVYEAERLGIPLYTVGIGDSLEQKDILISRLLANDVVLGGTSTPVDITVRSSGFDGERISVDLYDGPKLLDHGTLILEGGTREYTVRLSYIPEREGTQRYTVRIPALPGEITAANNQRTFSVHVLKSSLHILIIAGSPSPDGTVVKQTLSEQPNITVRSFTEKKGSGYYEGTIPREVVDSTDCLVLIGFPTANTQPATLGTVKHLLDERSVPLFFISGHLLDTRRLPALGTALPFDVTGAAGAEELVSPRVGEASRGNPLIELGGESSVDSWNRLPPVYRLRGAYRARPEATTLVTASLLNVPTREPLFLTRSVGRQKSAALAAYGIWRWRLMAQSDNTTRDFLSSFLYAAVRWLTTPEDLRHFRVAPTQESFPRGEPATFTGQLTSSTGQPIDDARVRVVAKAGDQVAETDLRPLGGGRYEGSVEGLGEGDYTFRATADRNGESAGEDSGKFSVGAMDLEFRETRMNIELLRQLAYRTGGSYFSPGEFGKFDSVLHAQSSFVSRTTRSTLDLELWHWRTLLAIVVALFALEWLLRKWHGML